MESVQFSKDEIRTNVIVPSSVEQELVKDIEQQLDKCGLFYRVFSRVKSPSSLAHKYATGKYNQEKKIQDLVGIRINLYFEDDMNICKEILENLFDLAEDEWSTTVAEESKFEAAKVNGVFHLPARLIQRITPKTWEMSIDQTFEIQLKTVLFEGWHEVEHDFRYKLRVQNGEDSENIWEDYPELSRHFNSIVATLELCDNSLVQLFENMAHALYKDGKYAMMLRFHFRIRLNSDELYDGLDEILRKNGYAKLLFKCKRSILIRKLLKRRYDDSLSVNNIIEELYSEVLNNDREISDILYKNKKQRRMKIHRIQEQRIFSPLTQYRTFNIRVNLCPRIRNHGIAETYRIVDTQLFTWFRNHFDLVFPDIPNMPCNYQNMTYGYNISYVKDDEMQSITLDAVNISKEMISHFWNTHVEVRKNEDDTLSMTICTSIYTGKEMQEKDILAIFSYPRCYSAIYMDKHITVMDDHFPISLAPRRPGTPEDIKTLSEFIKNPKRNFPIILMASDPVSPGSKDLDESWICPFWLDQLIKPCGIMIHTAPLSTEQFGQLTGELGIEIPNHIGIYFFYPNMADFDRMNYYQDFLADIRIGLSTLALHTLPNNINLLYFSPEYINRCHYTTYDDNEMETAQSAVENEEDLSLTNGPLAFQLLLIDSIHEINQNMIFE